MSVFERHVQVVEHTFLDKFLDFCGIGRDLKTWRKIFLQISIGGNGKRDWWSHDSDSKERENFLKGQDVDGLGYGEEISYDVVFSLNVLN